MVARESRSLNTPSEDMPAPAVYLFTSTDNGTLELFRANALEGPYHPYPRRPVVSGDG
jgi:hypothetical protein